LVVGQPSTHDQRRTTNDDEQRRTTSYNRVTAHHLLRHSAIRRSSLDALRAAHDIAPSWPTGQPAGRGVSCQAPSSPFARAARLPLAQPANIECFFL